MSSSFFGAVREMTKSKIVGFLFNDDDDDDNERQIIKFNIRRRRRKCYSTAVDVGVVGDIPAAAVVVNVCRYVTILNTSNNHLNNSFLYFSILIAHLHTEYLR